MIINLIATVFPVFGTIFLGAAILRFGLFPAATAYALNQFVYWIGLPALIFTLLGRLDTTAVPQAYFAGFFGALLLSYGLCFAAVLLWGRVRAREAAMLSCLSCFPNTGFMGVAMLTFLLPGNDEALSVAGLATVLYSPVLLLTDAGLAVAKHGGEGGRRILAEFARSMLRNPMLLACLAGLGLNFSGLGFFRPLMNMTSMLGATAAPCALFAIGMVLAAQASSARLRESFRLTRQIPVHCVKLLILPGLTYAVLRLFGLSGLTLGVTTLSSAMPIGVAAYVVAEKFQVCAQDTSTGIFFNTAVSLVSLPLIMVWLRTAGAL
ncbi:MAG: AEC family transporter [Desulfovibrio sp.]|jgi:predicted permease|nr:AEC family transporter [Desulfovibrio sp.]